MAEYIEREQVKDELLSWAVCINHPVHLLKEDALCVIDAIPAADVVPVVRCGECKYFNNLTCKIRKGSWGEQLKVGFTDFCSDGERRSDGT